ncbi:MAG: peptide ABC transporter substrate-binding protein [Chloroflexota bacterium]
MMTKRYASIALLMTILMVLSACVAPAAPSSGGDMGDMADGGDMGPVTLNWNLGTEPPSLDPSLATDTASVAIVNETMLGLTELDPDTQEAIPELATSWEVSEDGTVWTFSLRDDVPWVTFADGEVVEVTDDNGDAVMVNAHDVVYGVTRTCDARTASDYSYVLYVIAGCEEVNTAEEVTDELVDGVGVVALDDWTVEFTLNYGASYFGQIASMWVTRPMPQWLIEAEGDLWTEAGVMQNNGPYVLAEWIHNDSLQLVKNPFWYGWEEMADAVGNIDVINMTTIEEVSTEFAMYENNEIDLAGVPLEQMDRVSDPNGEFAGEYVSTARNCTYYYGFITNRDAVSDARVRQALSMTVDRATLSEQVLKGGQIPANTFTNPLNYGSPAEDPDIAPWALSEAQGGTGYAGAVEMAQGLMEEAGYPGGAGLELKLGHNVSESHAKIAQAIQAMWSEAFPEIGVVIETQEWGVYLDSLDADAPTEGKPDVFRLGWCQDYPHANNWIHEVFNPEAGANRTMISADDEQVGAIVAEFTETTIAAQTASPEAQLELYKQAEKLFIEDIAGIIPIYYYTRNVVSKPWLNRIYADDLYMYRWSIDVDAKSNS